MVVEGGRGGLGVTSERYEVPHARDKKLCIVEKISSKDIMEIVDRDLCMDGLLLFATVQIVLKGERISQSSPPTPPRSGKARVCQQYLQPDHTPGSARTVGFRTPAEPQRILGEAMHITPDVAAHVKSLAALRLICTYRIATAKVLIDVLVRRGAGLAAVR